MEKQLGQLLEEMLENHADYDFIELKLNLEKALEIVTEIIE